MIMSDDGGECLMMSDDGGECLMVIIRSVFKTERDENK